MDDDVPFDHPVRAAVRAGGRDLAGDPAFMSAILTNLREQAGEMAKNEAGSWVLGWVRWFIGKTLVGLLIMLVLWKTGGMAAVLAWLNGPTK